MLYDKSVTAYTLLILMLSKRKICDVDNMITVKYTHFRGEKNLPPNSDFIRKSCDGSCIDGLDS